LQRLERGTVRNATMGSADGSELLVTRNTTLDNVVLDANLRFSSGAELTLTVRNGLVLNGILTIASTSTSGRALTVAFAGTQTLSGTGTVVFGTTAKNRIRASSSSDVLTIGPGISIRADSGRGTVGISSADLVNQGRIVATAGASVTVTGKTVTNEGTIEAGTGGSVTVSALQPHSGTLAVGAGGSITVNGNFIQNPGGVVDIDIGGTASNTFGRLIVTGNANLAGTLNLFLVDGFEPVLGNSFRILTFGSRVGEFDVVTGLDFPNSITGTPVYTGTDLSIVAGGTPLQAVTPGAAPPGEFLTLEEAQLLLAEARRRWSVALGISAEDIESVVDVDMRIDNLQGAFVGFTAGSMIWLDDDAAGNGWFVDPTPSEDGEFDTVVAPTELRATVGAAAERVDLLTTLIHEVGHRLGQRDKDEPFNLMNRIIEMGIRRLPSDIGLVVTTGANADSRGTDFWLTFPANAGLAQADPELSLVITAEATTTGTVSIPGLDFTREFVAVPGLETTVVLPLAADLGFTSDRVTQKGIHVSSDSEITVFGVSRAAETSDVFLGLPSDLLGTDYIVLGYPNVDLSPTTSETFPGTEFAIVAGQDGTTLTITPAIATGVHAAGVPYIVSLNRGETYQLQNFGFEPADLSGTIIQSDRPIAVFGGHAAANIPAPAVEYADYLVEQLPPVNLWGTQYLSAPFATRGMGDTFRFLASENNTAVSVNGAQVAVLERGQLHEVVLTEASEITSDRPILVAQYANSAEFDGTQADPFMLLLTPSDQLLDDYTIFTGVEGIESEFVNLLVPNDALGTVILDGAFLPVDPFEPIGTSGFSNAQIAIKPGTHRIKGPVPFGLYTYGFGLDQAYGYPGGWAEAPGAPVVVADLALTPSAASLLVGTQHTVTARAGDPDANPIAGVAVQFAVSGAHEISAVVLTDSDGLAVFSYEGVAPGPNRIEATIGSLSEVATATWSAGAPTIEVLEPVDGSSLPAGETALIVGRATHGPATEFVSITVDGRPVDTFDSEGNFFHRVTVAPGYNHFELLVIDGFGQTAGTTLSLTGAQPSEREAEIALLQTIVSSSFVAEYGRTSFDESGRILHVDLAVRNDGTYATDAPIFVAIDHLSDPGIRVAGFDGTAPEGLPYYDFSDVVANGSLLPGELSGSRTLAFFNPEQIRFTFDLVFFGQLNEAPAITSIPDVEAVVGNAYHYALEAGDPDGDPLGFSLLTAPAGMVIDSVSQRITWTPTVEDAGNHAIAIRAEDGRGGTVKQRFSLAVVRAPPNRPPFFRSAPRVDANVNTLYRYEPVALDSDSDPLTFELIEAPTGLTLDPATGVLEWTPNGDDFGSHDVGLEVSDSRGGAASQTFAISVHGEPGNNAPFIFSQPPASATQDKDFVYAVKAIDPDADVLGFSLPTAPAGMTIDEATGEVVWDGDSITIGEHQVTVQVADGRGGFDTQIFTVGAIANRDPVIISTPILEAREGQTYGFFIEASDPDGNPLTFGLTQAPSGMSVATIDEDTGLLTWTPTGGQLGPNPVTLEVSDGRGGSASQAFVIEVGAALPNQQPTITSAPLTDAVAGRDYDYLVIAFDPDGDLVSFELLEAPDGMVIDGVGGRITWTPSADHELTPVQGAQFDILGLAHVSVQASDGRGGIDLQEFDILVRAIDNLPPRIDSIPPEEATVGALYRYDAFGSDPDGDALTFELLASAGRIPEDFGFESGVLILTADGLVSSLEERGIPVGMTLDPETGVLLWTPQLDDVIFDLTGPFDVREVIIRASDGKGGFDVQSFPITVRLPNAAPVITSTPPARAHVGLPFLYDVAAQDFDRDEVTFALGGAPAGMTIDAQTGEVRWTPNAAQLGDQPVNVLASDGRGGEAQQSFDLTVVADEPNNVPVILSTPRDSAPIGREYRYLVEVSDPDADPLNVVLETGPLGLRLDNEQRLVSWTPDHEQIGRHQVSLRVEDGRGGLAAQSFTLEAVTGLENARPEIVSTPPLRAAPDQLYAYNVEALDADGDLLAYQLPTGPVGMSIDVAPGTVRWEPGQDQVGEHAVRVEVFDQYGLGVLQDYVITVGDSNRSPILRSVPPTTAAVDVPYFYALDAADPNGDPLGFELLAAPAGMTIDAARRLIEWTPSTTQRGLHDIEIAVSDGFGGTASQRFAVEVLDTAPNQPPQIISAPPLSALVGELYAHDVDALDPEAGAITFSLRTAPDGMVIEAETGILQWTPTTQQLPAQEVAIVATDDAANGAVLSFTIGVFRDNQGPAITSDPDIAIVGLPYSYDVEAVDPDGDPLTYGLLQAPEGMTIDSLGRVSWLPGPEDAGTKRVEITVEDPFGAGVTQTINLPVLADSQAPLVQLVLSDDPVLVSSNVTFTVNAVDDVRIAAIGLRVGGEAVALDADGRAILRFDTAAEVEAVATAIDVAGNRAEALETVLVVDPSDATAPVVSIASPVDGDMITSFVDIIGTVDDDNLLSYTLSVAPLDGQFTQIFRGTEPVVDGVLGTFDPTMFTNDMYEIRIEARDAGGNVSEHNVFVSVAGDLKLGNFTLSFDDLVIPVSGIPITVSRTYDTLTADREGDFGFGWRLEFAETRLRTSIPETGQEAFGSFSAIRGGDRVYATLPGGRRVGFTFEPRLINPVLALYGFDFWEPVFAADPGVTEELTVPNVQLGRNPDGSFFALSANRYNPANPIFGGGYTLTTNDGIVYDVDGRTGDLRALGDLNGNTLTFTEDGIFSSTGEAVLFERDPRGRIVAVIDPMGNRITCAYDDSGDLVTATDREGHTTEFHYNADRAHFLEQVIDPLGRRGIRSEYDDNGRLVRLIDAGDEVIELIHDPENSLETVIDARGNPTVYEYDTRGNVITEVDALGGITTRTYDGNNFMLSETNPLGHTTSFTYDSGGNVLIETDPLGNVTRFTYGSFGRVLTTTDPLGNTTTNTYDRVGNLTSVTESSGRVTTVAYDISGNATSVTDPSGTLAFSHGGGNVVRSVDALGNVSTFTYDANGNPLTETRTLTTPADVISLETTFTYDANGRNTSVTDAEGGITRTEYDSVGNIAATIDALGRRTEFRYDDRGLLVEKIFPDETPERTDDNPRQITAYDEAGNRVAVTDEAGLTTRFVYDALFRLVETIFPDGTPADPDDNPRSLTEYDKAGQIIAEVDELGNRTEFEYDAAGNQIRVRDALENETQFEYDAAGRLTRTIDALGQISRMIYDDHGRPITTILADGRTISQTYNDAGRLSSRTNQTGNTTRFEYDGLGRHTAVVDALQQRTEYTYDEAGNLTRQTDANGRETHFEYDGLGRRMTTILPLGQQSTETYDAVGNVVSKTDFNGDTMTFEYDERNRLVAKRFPDGTSVGFRYTSNGLRDSITDASGVTSFEYDERNRLLKRIDPDGTAITCTYDAAGNKLRVTVPSGTTTYTYDELNRLKTITDPDDGVTIYTYDELSRLVGANLPNGTFEIRTYDEQNRLLLIEHRDTADNTLLSFRYTLNEVGDRIRVVEYDGRQVEYGYDGLRRLRSETIIETDATMRTITYTYDPVGNRLTRDDSAEGLTNYTYDDNDRLLTETMGTSTTTYTYDDNGNTLSKVTDVDNQTAYVWDFENRLVRIVVVENGTATVVEYQYDADGIRMARIVDGDETRFLVDSERPFAQVLEEYAADGTVIVTYVYGPDLVSQVRGGARSYYHVDGLGSTRALTDANGLVTDRYWYDAYGQTIARSGDTENVYLFAGEQRGASVGLDYLRARYLDSRTGRLLSVDPFAGFIRDPLSLHPYMYASANPVLNTDPSGLFTLAELNITQAVVHTLAFISRASSLVQASRSAVDLVQFLSLGLHLGAAMLQLAFAVHGHAPGSSVSFSLEYIYEKGRIFKSVGVRYQISGATGSGSLVVAIDVAEVNKRVSGGKFRAKVDLPSFGLSFSAGLNFLLYELKPIGLQSIAKVEAVARGTNKGAVRLAVQANFLGFGRFAYTILEAVPGQKVRLAGAEIF